MKVCGETNWPKSLSGVTIQDSNPSASARFTSVPMMSSASKPSQVSNGDVEGLDHAAHVRERGAQVLGHPSRCALYSGKSTCRCVGASVSKATAICVGCRVLMMSSSVLVKP